MTDDSHELEVALFDFRARFAADSALGRVASVESYTRRFPGFEAQIRVAYARLMRGEPFDSAEFDGRAPPPPIEAERRIAHYRLLHELGRGGQGSVHLAEDTRLHRRVAIKLLAGLAQFSSDARRRFQREAETASRLDHPGICTVYESGVDDGTAYIAMRYVEGESLGRRIARARDTRAKLDAEPGATGRAERPELEALFPCAPASRDDLWACLRFFESAARALHVAHEAGIVHRDVKPGNVMITTERMPVVLDFGLARDAEPGAEAITLSGEIQGTPAYLSPEQLEPKGRRLDRRTDVYSLGVALYECLTLEPPFQAPTIAALYQQILRDPPRDPRTTNRSIPTDLAVVLETALEKDRDRRYASALDFAEDLRRIREHEPIRARPPSVGLRALRWVQRNPARAVGLGGAALVAAALVVIQVIRSRNDVLARTVEQKQHDIDARKQANDDRAMQDRLLDILAHTPMRGGIHDWAAECRAYLDAYSEYGVPLEGPTQIGRAIETIEAARTRDSELADDLIDGLYRITWTMEDGSEQARRGADGAVPADLSPMALAGPPWLQARRSALSLIDRFESSEWRRSIWARYRAWLASHRERPENEPALRTFQEASARDLLFLGEITYLMRRGTAMLPVLDAALAKSSPNPGLRFAIRIDRGIALAGSGAAEQAILDLTVACELRPKSAPAWISLASAQQRAGRLRDAVASAQQATAADDRNAAAWRVLADACLQDGRFESAERAALRAVELRSADSMPHSILARIALHRRDPRRAIEEWTAAARTGALDTWRQAAELLVERAGNEDPMPAILSAVLEPTERATLLARYGRALRERGCLEAAAFASECARWVAPADSMLAFAAAEAWGAIGEFARARECCEVLVRLDPKHVLGHVRLASALLKLGMLDDACAAADRALFLDAGPLVALARARVLAAAGRARDADEAYRALVDATPGDLVARRELADLERSGGEFVDELRERLEILVRSAQVSDFSLALRSARELREAGRLGGELSRAIDRHADVPRLLLLEAQLALSGGARETALRSLRAAQAIVTNEVADLVLLAEVCRNCGSWSASADAAQRALRLAPDSVAPRKQLFAAQDRLYDYDAALRTASAWLALAPDDSDALWNVTVMALRLGTPEVALRHAEAALEARTHNAKATRCVSMALRWMGETARAQRLVDDELKADPSVAELYLERGDIAGDLGAWPESEEAYEEYARRARIAVPAALPQLLRARERDEAAHAAATELPASVTGFERVRLRYLSGDFAEAVRELDALASHPVEAQLDPMSAQLAAQVLARDVEARLAELTKAGDGGAEHAPSRSEWTEAVVRLAARASAAIEMLCEGLPASIEAWRLGGAAPAADPRIVGRNALVDRDLRVLLVPPLGAPWTARARAAFARLRETLRQPVDL